MATVDVIANRSTASEILGKAYFETDTNSFIVYNGYGWVELQSDGTGAAPPFNQYSVDLDGLDDHVRVTHDASLNISGDFTMSAWVYFTGTSAGNIMSKRGTTGTPHWQWYIDTGNSNKPTFVGSSTLAASSGISLNTWTHLMLVSGGTSVAHYINGVLSGFSSITLGASNSNDITIGAVDYPSNGSPVGNFAGYIDEVALFDTQSTALTTALSTSSPTDLTSLNPLGWWRMGDNDDITGTTVTDQGVTYDPAANGGSGGYVASGNDGALTNGPTFSTNVPT